MPTTRSPYGMWTYVDQITNFLIWLAIVNLDEGHCNLFLNLKVRLIKTIGGQSGDTLSLQSDHINPPKCVTS